MSPRVSPKSWADQMIQEDLERERAKDEKRSVDRMPPASVDLVK